jgi:hypothetical protein
MGWNPAHRQQLWLGGSRRCGHIRRSGLLPNLSRELDWKVSNHIAKNLAEMAGDDLVLD